MLAACQSQTKTPPRAQTNWACGNLQILPRSKLAKDRAFDAGGLRHCRPVFFSHPNMGSRNSPSAVTLKKRCHRKFHRVLALIPVVSNLLYKSNASGSQRRFLTTLPREEAFHLSHLFRHQPSPRPAIKWRPFLMKNISSAAGFQEVAGWTNKGLRVIRV